MKQMIIKELIKNSENIDLFKDKIENIIEKKYNDFIIKEYEKIQNKDK
jgi:hypothetical protein